MKSMDIQYRQSYSVRKSAFVEAFNGTIQNLIAAEREGDGGGDPKYWIGYWRQALKKYNFTNVHTFIKMTPFEAEQQVNQAKVAHQFDLKYKKIKKKRAKLKIGDIVRIFRDKGKFGRKYHQDYSDELFEIEKVFINMPHPRYQIKDMNGQTILGNFLEEELSRFIP